MKEIVVQGMNGEMVVEGDKITVKHTGPLFLGKREEIGRASCRERVGSSV